MSDMLQKKLEKIFSESLEIRKSFMEHSFDNLIDAAKVCAEALKNGNQIFTMGNGGSAADAQHFAAELVGKFYKLERKALPATALTTNTSTLTALSNDYSYDVVFSRQLEAFVRPGDVVVGLSTSGNADSVLRGFRTAIDGGAKALFLTGETGGKIREEVKDLSCIIKVSSKNTGRIQELHITVIHAICELIEAELFPDGQ